MQNKVLSIAMPCYNVESYLARGLGSLADERLANDVEVLIVNDGSSDSTEEIALDYARRFPSLFFLVNKENGGHGSAVNSGLREAHGKYFRVIDGDDWVSTEGLVKLVDFLKTSDADVVVDEMSSVNMADMKATHQHLPAFVNEGEPVSFTGICNQGGIESYMAIHTLNFKTELLKGHDVSLREGIFYVDYEYIVKGTCFAQTVSFLRSSVYQYLTGNAGQSMASHNMVKRYRHHEAVLRELLDFEERNPQFSAEVRRYLQRKIQLLIHTHYNVLLIFDDDRKQGSSRAKAFDAWLKKEHPHYYAITKRRRLQAWTLHYLGFNAERLNKLMGR